MTEGGEPELEKIEELTRLQDYDVPSREVSVGDESVR